MILRNQIVDIILQDAKMENGTVTLRTTVEGKAVKAVRKLSYRLDEAALSTIWNYLPESDKACIKLKPTLQAAKYKKLLHNSMLHEAVVSKLAAPTLEVK